jgi:hypothetical protein
MTSPFPEQKFSAFIITGKMYFGNRFSHKKTLPRFRAAEQAYS